jgi:hypothetical protein
MRATNDAPSPPMEALPAPSQSTAINGECLSAGVLHAKASCRLSPLLV